MVLSAPPTWAWLSRSDRSLRQCKGRQTSVLPRLAVLFCIKKVNACTSICTSMYQHVQYITVHVCTSMYQHVPVHVCTSMYQYMYVPVCTSMYQYMYVPACTSTCMYQHVPVHVCTSMYQHVPVPACTSMYQHVPACTSMYDATHYNKPPGTHKLAV